jgi:hypothetical protein
MSVKIKTKYSTEPRFQPTIKRTQKPVCTIRGNTNAANKPANALITKSGRLLIIL